MATVSRLSEHRETLHKRDLARYERELVQRARKGDREAFHEIVEANKQRMLTIARGIVMSQDIAEDVIQEAFVKAYVALPNFRGDSKLSTWLYRITFSTAIDFRRKIQSYTARIRQINPDDEFEHEIVDLNSERRPEKALESDRLRSHIDKALEHLTPFEQSVFTLRHSRNLKLKDIAEVLDRSEGTIKNILFRAIRKMRDNLSHLEDSLQEQGINRC